MYNNKSNVKNIGCHDSNLPPTCPPTPPPPLRSACFWPCILRTLTIQPRRSVRVNFWQKTWPWNSDKGQQKCQKTTQRWFDTATATDKSANTTVKYRKRQGFLHNKPNIRFWKTSAKPVEHYAVKIMQGLLNNKANSSHHFKKKLFSHSWNTHRTASGIFFKKLMAM